MDVKISAELFEALRRYFSYFEGVKVEYAEMIALRTYILGSIKKKVSRQKSRETFIERKFGGTVPESARVREPRKLTEILANENGA